jgi:hypothetical protein
MTLAEDMSPTTDDGVMTLSIGFMVVDGVQNSEGYISPPGTEAKDSAGESSNLTWGVDVWLSEDSILGGGGWAGWIGGLDGVFAATGQSWW